MLCVTVTGLWVSEVRARAISNYPSCLAKSAQRIGRLLLVGLWSNERLELVANSRLRRNRSDKMRIFKNQKKLVTSEPIETKEVTNFFVDRKIKELKVK